MPALSLPLLHGADGLPIGVQLIGKRFDDAGVLRLARAIENLVYVVAAAQVGRHAKDRET